MPEYEIAAEDQLKTIAERFTAFEESLQSLHERFDRIEKKQKEEMELLKTVIVHVRKRVEVVDRKRWA